MNLVPINGYNTAWMAEVDNKTYLGLVDMNSSEWFQRTNSGQYVKVTKQSLYDELTTCARQFLAADMLEGQYQAYLKRLQSESQLDEHGAFKGDGVK